MLLYALSLLAIREHGGGMDVQHRAVASLAANEGAAHELGLQIAQRDYPAEAGWTSDVRLLEIATPDRPTVFDTGDNPPHQYEVRLTVAAHEHAAGPSGRRPMRTAPPLDEATAALDEDKRWGGEGG